MCRRIALFRRPRFNSDDHLTNNMMIKYRIMLKNQIFNLLLIITLVSQPGAMAQHIEFLESGNSKLITNRFTRNTQDDWANKPMNMRETLHFSDYIDERQTRVDQITKELKSKGHKFILKKSGDEIVVVDETKKWTHRFFSRRSTVKVTNAKAQVVFAEIFPENQNLAYQLSKLFEEERNWIKAIEFLKKSHREPKGNGDVNDPEVEYYYHATHAFLLCQLKEFDKALTELNLALQIHPDSKADLNNRANILVMLGRRELAQKDYEKLKSLREAENKRTKPKSLKDLLASAKPIESFQRDNYEGLIEHQRRLIATPEKGQSQSSTADMRRREAHYLICIGRYSEALNVYKQLRTSEKSIPAITSERQHAETLCKLPPINYAFLSVLNNKPQDTYAIGPKKSIKTLTAAQIAADHKGDMRVLEEEARQLILVKRPKDALIELNKVMLVVPSAEILRKKLECEEATQDWKACAIDATAYIDALRSNKYNWENADFAQYLFGLRARANKQLRKFNESISDLNVFLKIEPDSAEAYRDRADCYYASGKYSLAVDDYTKSIKFDDTKTAPNYLLRATAYEKLGKADLAKADRDMALKLDGTK